MFIYHVAAIFMSNLDDVILSVDGAAPMLAQRSSDRPELHSENKHFKSCFLVVLWAKHELRYVKDSHTHIHTYRQTEIPSFIVR